MCLSSALSETQFEKKRKQLKEGIIDKQQKKEENLTQGNNWYHTVFSTRKDYIQDNSSNDKEERVYHLEE